MPVSPKKTGAPVPKPRQAQADDNPAFSSDAELHKLCRAWHEVIDRVGKVRSLAGNCLLDAKPLSLNGRVLVLGFDPEFPDTMERVRHPKTLQVIRKVIEDVLGFSIDLELRVMDAKDTLPGDIKMPARRDRMPTENLPSANDGMPRTKKDWAREPAVRKVLEMFNGDIIDVRE